MVSLTRFDCDDYGVMFPHSDGDWCEYKEAADEIERLTAGSNEVRIATLSNEHLMKRFGYLEGDWERRNHIIESLTARVKELEAVIVSLNEIYPKRIAELESESISDKLKRSAAFHDAYRVMRQEKDDE